MEDDVNKFLDDEYLNYILPNRVKAVQFTRELAELGFQYAVKYRWLFIHEGYLYSLCTGDFYSAPSKGRPDVKSGWDKFDGMIRVFGTDKKFNCVGDLVVFHNSRPPVEKKNEQVRDTQGEVRS